MGTSFGETVLVDNQRSAQQAALRAKQLKNHDRINFKFDYDKACDDEVIMSSDFEETQESKEQSYYYNKEIQRLKQQHRYD